MTACPEYDYVILGAGSAGCVLANRLSADPLIRVALVEAGGRDLDPLIKVPLMAGRWFVGKRYNWSFVTEPQVHLAGRRISWPRGKVWGGSSAINGMIYVRGHPRDYDAWAEDGAAGWGWEDVLPYFRQAEGFASSGDGPGEEGPLPITRPAIENPLYPAFVNACAQAGHPLCDDFNGSDPHGAGYYDYNIRGGQRWSTARAYLHPVLHRPNLTVLSRTHVLRVTVDGRRASGADVLQRGSRIHLRARRDVILAAGVVGSPAILLHSGIGEAAALRSLGIAPRIELPGVGRNLQDHLQVMVTHETRTDDGVYDLRRIDRAVPAVFRSLATGRGPATVFPTQAGAFLKTDAALAIPDIQLHFILGAGGRGPRWPLLRETGLYQGYGFTGSVCQLRPESRGRIYLGSADPLAPPVIDPNYLSSPADRAAVRRGVRTVRDIFAQHGLSLHCGAELAPGADVRSDTELDRWIAQSAQSIYHPVGTCRMGRDPLSVVDQQLRVRGVDGLRVADASVMPQLIGGNTHGATVMIAERAATMIAEPAHPGATSQSAHIDGINHA